MSRLTYIQTTGELFGLPCGPVIGYSGYPPYVNDADAERMKAEGPIPCGRWKLGAPIDSPHLGPFAIPLEPLFDDLDENGSTIVDHFGRPIRKTDTFGRDAFFIHGDSMTHPGYASHGCIIQNRSVREEIVHTGTTEILVVATKPTPE